MALTCSYWHEIAMEVLWRELPSLVPLFMLMPEDAWCAPRGERTPLEPIRFGLRRTVTSHDWHRVHRYARHVRSLRIQPQTYRKSIAKALRASESDGPLFPGLRHLSFASQWDWDKCDHLAILRMLLSPSLAHLAIDIPNSYLEKLSCLAPICSALTTFSFTDQGYADARPSPADLSACVRAWPALTSISLNGSAGMSQLMPALALCDSAGVPDAVFAPCSPSGAYPRASFAALRDLTIGGQSAAYVVGLMKSWGVRPIERLSVFGLELPAEAARALIADIPTHCEPTALSKLMISATSPGWRLRAEDVAPLAKCTGLTSLVLNVSDGADIADVEYETLARSWPLLQRVEFPGSYDRAVAPRCTMAALGAFAGACTHLESIVLSFDANMDAVPSPSLSNTTVTHLNVVDSPIDESYAPRVAERLATLFPSLTWIEDDYDDGRYEESQAGWVVADAAMRARARAQRAKVWAAERSAVKAKLAAAAATSSARSTSSPSLTSPSRATTSSSVGTSYFDALREQCIIV
ncbi:hypothetical protein K525DRAFT_209643 [Schizophyllum commune Loenen D]|nr:hypothetical protein K525DRAFT_209643 [Schizophyllum commune Loenen D]